jgi:hypothetical protein
MAANLKQKAHGRCQENGVLGSEINMDLAACRFEIEAS